MKERNLRQPLGRFPLRFLSLELLYPSTSGDAFGSLNTDIALRNESVERRISRCTVASGKFEKCWPF